MKFKNYEIVQHSEELKKYFLTENNNQYLPIKLNYAIQKNLASLLQNYASIDSSRNTICKHYGTLNDAGDAYHFPPETIDVVNNELQDLYNIEVEVAIMLVKLSDIENLELTPNQMNAIMFMIEE